MGKLLWLEIFCELFIGGTSSSRSNCPGMGLLDGKINVILVRASMFCPGGLSDLFKSLNHKGYPGVCSFARILLLRSGISKWSSFNVLQFECEKGKVNASAPRDGCVSDSQSI